MTNFNKNELLLYYGSAYLIVAILETILFSAILGDWTFRIIMLNFSIWGIIWLVSMFAFPLFIVDADPTMLALSPYLSLLGYVIIIGVFYVTYRIHIHQLEKRTKKKLSFSKMMDLYFPIEEEKE